MDKVNADLQIERDTCTFNVKELTCIIDGGEKQSLERKEREEYFTRSFKEGSLGPSEEYLSHQGKYEYMLERSCYIFKHIRQMQDNGLMTVDNYRHTIAGILYSSVIRDGSPFGVHYIMFMPAIINLGTEEQKKLWLPRAWNCRIIGTFAQTELGHGTFIRGLETTATYDPAAQEFVLNTPTLTSRKWWAGGLGQTANYCILVAQLYTKGECHGVHCFIVQLRDEETHMPLPGIEIGNIGPKLGLNTVDNGYLKLDNVRIPRKNMLMKHSQVLEDGTYLKSQNSKLNYAAMVFVRVVISFDMVNFLSKAITIATRYSAVRRQCQYRADEPEMKILDYLTQQHKLFIGLASCHALRVSAKKLWDNLNEVTAQINERNLERLPELHAMACCLKAITTSDCSSLVEKARLACGGHGYMVSSNLPLIYGQVTAACTYEGENTVLLLQTARFLMKTWQQLEESTKMTPTVAYLKFASQDGFLTKWDQSVEGITKAFQVVAMRRVSGCVESMKGRILSGTSQTDAWNATSVQLVAASEAHCRVIILSSFLEETGRLAKVVSPELREVLYQLLELYTVYWALERLSDLLQFTNISQADIQGLQRWYEDLLGMLRPNAVGLVDAFDIRDAMLQSTLGAWDGRVYERLMEEARRCPVNAQPVNPTFHTHLKPFMQGKL